MVCGPLSRLPRLSRRWLCRRGCRKAVLPRPEQLLHTGGHVPARQPLHRHARCLSVASRLALPPRSGGLTPEKVPPGFRQPRQPDSRSVCLPPTRPRVPSQLCARGCDGRFGKTPGWASGPEAWRAPRFPRLDLPPGLVLWQRCPQPASQSVWGLRAVPFAGRSSHSKRGPGRPPRRLASASETP